MIDAFGREIDYLRVSVTDRCNLRCQYCMPEDLPLLHPTEILRSEEFLRVCRVMSELGIRHIRVTGGEPLVRLGVVDLLREMGRLPGVERLTLTTNGVLLHKYIDDLLDAGLDGVNISLDTLDRDTYRAITGFDHFEAAWSGVEAALDAGLRVKINCVPLAGINEGELHHMAALAERWPVDVRFIEAMPIGAGQAFAPIDSMSILEGMLGIYPDLYADDIKRGSGPARYYTSAALKGSIGFISALTDCFCESCNRIRLTSEGQLKLCLYYDEGLDIRALLRGGADDETLKAAILEALLFKPERHRFDVGVQPVERKKMYQIGG